MLKHPIPSEYTTNDFSVLKRVIHTGSGTLGPKYVSEVMLTAGSGMWLPK